MAGRVYWRAWQGRPVKFKATDAKRCPRHWQTCGTRVSALTGSQSPRKAVNPANAVLNYLYAILEAEARIAALAVGLDPVLGLMYTDQRNRDSLAADLMEPIRPDVDAYLLGLLDRHTFSRSDVHELLTGQCRLLPPLSEKLAATAPIWARRVLPVAQQLAAKLLESERQLVAGEAVSKAGRQAARRRRAQRVVTREYRARVDPVHDPRRGPAAGLKRRRAMASVVAANRAWEESTGQPADLKQYREFIAPGLHRLPLKALMATTGLTKGACSKIRSGSVVPHPRHWEALQRAARGSTWMVKT